MRSVRVLRCAQVRMASDTCCCSLVKIAIEILSCSSIARDKIEGFALPTVPKLRLSSKIRLKRFSNGALTS